MRCKLCNKLVGSNILYIVRAYIYIHIHTYVHTIIYFVLFRSIILSRNILRIKVIIIRRLDFSIPPMFIIALRKRFLLMIYPLLCFMTKMEREISPVRLGN